MNDNNNDNNKTFAIKVLAETPVNINSDNKVPLPSELSADAVMPTATQRVQVYACGSGDDDNANQLPSTVAAPLVSFQRGKAMAQALTNLSAYKSIGVVPSLRVIVAAANAHVQGRSINHCTAARAPFVTGLDLDEQDSTDAPTLLFCLANNANSAASVSMLDKETGTKTETTMLKPGKLIVLSPADYARYRYVVKPDTAAAAADMVFVILRAVTRTRTRAEVIALNKLHEKKKKTTNGKVTKAPKAKKTPKCIAKEEEEEDEKSSVIVTKNNKKRMAFVLSSADDEGDEEEEEEEEDDDDEEEEE